jgi:hypothetical protein
VGFVVTTSITREQVFVPMIEAKRKFSQVKVEKLLRHSAIYVEPMLGITPEAFNAIETIPTFGTASLFLTTT